MARRRDPAGAGAPVRPVRLDDGVDPLNGLMPMERIVRAGDALVTKTKYTPQRAKRVLMALRAGNTRRASAAAGGITDMTFRRWLRDKPQFAAEVYQAEAAAERLHTNTIQAAAASGDIRAAEFWLERRRPTEWGRVDRVELLMRDQAAEFVQTILAEDGIVMDKNKLLEKFEAKRQRALPPGSKRR